MNIFRKTIFLLSLIIIGSFTLFLQINNKPLIPQAKAFCIVPAPQACFGVVCTPGGCLIDSGNIKDAGKIAGKLVGKSFNETIDILDKVNANGGNACAVIVIMDPFIMGTPKMKELIIKYGCKNLPDSWPDILKDRDCSSYTDSGRSACEGNSKGRCFWYSGGVNSSPSCVDNNGNMNNNALCRDGGHCYKGEECSNGNYCSSSDPAITCPVDNQTGNVVRYSCEASCPTDSSKGGESSNKSLTCSGSDKCCFYYSNYTPAATMAPLQTCSQQKGVLKKISCSAGSHVEDSSDTDEIYVCCVPDTVTPTGGGGSGSSLPAEPGVGYCAGANRENPQAVGEATCGVNNAPYESESQFCIQKFGGSLGNFFKCSTASTSTGICASHGRPDTVFSKPSGFWGSTCDGKMIGETDPKTAKEGRKYADRYKCSDGTHEDVPEPSSDKLCNEYPWIDTINKKPTMCKEPNSGGQIDCSQFADRECTLDFESSSEYSCVKKGFKWCAIQKKEIISSGSCKGIAGQGHTCGEDIQCNGYPDAICVNSTKAGIKTCQWKNGVAPSPTPGISSTCTSGTKGTGCACDAGPTTCGCATSHNPEPATDNPSKYYCVPFASGLKWCEKSQTAIPPAQCATAPVYTTPTPTPTISVRCPNDGNHVCAAAGSCVEGYGPKNDAIADGDCASWNPDTPKCYFKSATPLSSCTTAVATPTKNPSLVTSTPKPTPPGCPVDNGDGRVNSCQASCSDSYPNAKPDGNADCEKAYGTIRGVCCTSN